MNDKIKTFLILCVLLHLFIYSNAQNMNYPDSISTEVKPVDSIADVEGKKKVSFIRRQFQGNVDRTFEKKIDISFLAAPSYSQEGSFSLGGLLSGLYRIDRSDSTLSPSNISIGGSVSLRGFYNLSIEGNNYFKGNRSRLSFMAQFSSKNLDFWGINWDACQENPAIKYRRQQIRINADYIYNVKNHFHIGGQINVTQNDIVEIDDISYIEGQKEAYFFTGLGFSLIYDSRDYIPNPQAGLHLMLRTTVFPQFISSYDKSVLRATFIGNYYQKLWKGGVLAYDLYGEFNSDNAPWPLKEELGGLYRMRGYYTGRYIDAHIASVQAELRQHIAWRIGATAFIGCGAVFPSFQKFEMSNILPNYGIGLRFEFKSKTNLRMDYGFGKKAGGFVFALSEAF